MKKYIYLHLLLALINAGCKPQSNNSIGGKGGSGSVAVYPQHHEVAKNLVNMKVYVKYNTLDAPAGGAYDDSLSCTNHDSLSSSTFTGLKNGNYYFYGYGYDTSVNKNVKGGSPFTLSAQSTVSLEIAVSE
jgi:hypothetical protein